MKIKYLGTSASEGWPALFCECEACRHARMYKGHDLRTRNQALIDDTLLLDFPPDTNCHALGYGLRLSRIRSILITHSHHDHFFPADIYMRLPGYQTQDIQEPLIVYGNAEVERKFREIGPEFPDTEGQLIFRSIHAFESFDTPDGYHIEPVRADHKPSEEALNYIISKEGKTLLYAHDTGVCPEETFRYLKGHYFNIVSMDCTALDRNWRSGHLGFEGVLEVKGKLLEMKCIDEKTLFIISHFAHREGYTAERIEMWAKNHKMFAAYDGFYGEV